MNQLLPEIKNIFEQYLGEQNDYHIMPIENTDWKNFIELLEKVESHVNIAENDILDKCPVYMLEALKDAINTKKNHDRVFSCFVSSIALGEEPWDYVSIFYALELLDYSIIVVDDVLDKATIRGMKPCHYKKWGMSVSLNVSEILKDLSSNLILQSSIDDKTKIRILNEINYYRQKVYEGQSLDILLENMDIGAITLDDYTNLITLTTGYQFRGFFRISGILANAPDRTLDIISDIGLNCGIVGQIRDDLIDYIPDGNLTWKMPFSDFLQNKKRLPYIIGWKNATNNEKKAIVELREKENLSDYYHEIFRIIFKPGNLVEMRNFMLDKKINIQNKIQSGNYSDKGTSLLNSYLNLVSGSI